MKTSVVVAIGVAIALLLAGCTEQPPSTLGQTEVAGVNDGSGAQAVESSPTPSLRPITDLLDRPLPPSKARPKPVIGPLPRSAVDTTSSDTITGTSDLVLLPTTTPTPDATKPSPTSQDLVAIVDATLANLRGGPGTNYQIVAQARSDADVAVIGRDEAGDWLRICCPAGEEAESWISAELVKFSQPVDEGLANVPIASIPPTPEAPSVVQGGGQSAATLAAAAAPGLPGPGNFGSSSAVNPLTGLPLPANRIGSRPVIVCVNNDYAARPQYGTSQADVVYEYLMEGYGITRFSALYYGTPSSQIGPVRSARLINYYMGALYDAGLACSGASDQVRYLLKHQAPFPYMDIDLDDPSNSRYSDSIGSDYRTRLRTNANKLSRWLTEWGIDQPASIRGFTFGNIANTGVPASTLQIPYPRGTGSQVSYRYDPDSGRYLRSLGGGAHVDGNSGAQLAVENVIVQFVPHEQTNIVEDSLGSTSIRINLFGSGKAVLFRDGLAFEGSWRSESRGDTPHFTDPNGAEIPLKPGRTWISVVPLSYKVTY